MDFWMLAGRLLRRWYLALPMLIGATFVASAVASSVQPSYATETQILLAPHGSAVQAAANPLLLANTSQLDAATQSLKFVLESATSGAERQQVVPGADVAFQLVQEAPIVVVDVSAADAATVQRSTDVAVGQVEASLADLEDQLGTDGGSRIEAVQLGTPTVQEQSGDRRRVLMGGLGAALLGTTLVVLAIDQVLRRRQERRLSAGVERHVDRWAAGMNDDPTPRHRTG